MPVEIVSDPMLSMSGDPRHRRWLVLVVLAIISLVLLWRRPDIATNPQFWAEDGVVFFAEAHDYGLATVVWPYAGYFHVAARTSAWVMSWLPPEYAPHGYAFASWLVLALLTLYLFSDRFTLPTNERVILSVALVATTSSNEVFFNLANWATLIAPWLILLAVSREPETRGEAGFDHALLVVAGLSTPFTICLWLLFAARFAVRRGRHDAVLLGVGAAIAIVQLSQMGGRIAEPQAGPLLDRIDGIAQRIAFVFFGQAIPAVLLAGTARMWLFAGFGLLYVLTAWRAWASRAQETLLFLFAHALVMSVSFVVQRTWSEYDFVMHTGRHQYLMAVTLVWALGCLRMAPLSWLPVGLALAAFLFLNPGNKLEVYPDLHWGENVARCRADPQPCRIRINPTLPAGVWTVTISRIP